VNRASAALLAALVLTAANAAKPLVIDDPIFLAFAKQIASDPGDPYGFEFFWWHAPEPAIGFGWVPPVLPYWLAGAMTLLGDDPVAWKLSLLPFALALTGSLACLLARFAAPVAAPVLFALALSPAVLPGMNLMLDVPALALGLLGYATFVVACERRDPRFALAAGLSLGLALQTKYSACVYPALVLAHAALYRRPRECAIALLVAAALFAGWEGWLIGRYGESHFLAGVERARTLAILPAVARADAEAPGSAALYWTLCLLSLVGGTALLALLLALVGLGARRTTVSIVALAAGIVFAVVPWLPAEPAFEASGFFPRTFAYNPPLFGFVPLGLLALAGLAALAARALRGGGSADRRPQRVLAVWLLLETLGFFLVSPYPAVRRVLGFGVAAALLAGHAAAQREGARGAARLAAACAVALGCFYFAVDLTDARARRGLAPWSAERLAQLGADPARETIWYTGHWEFQFYAERAGMQPVVAGRSLLRTGDWLVLSAGTAPPAIVFPSRYFRREDERQARSASPWSTIPSYYDGPVPLRRQPERQAVVRLFRVVRDLVPQTRGVSPAPTSAR
jgi:hypothetical protein